jgi:DmsE family decaheme c-type cytochrome
MRNAGLYLAMMLICLLGFLFASRVTGQDEGSAQPKEEAGEANSYAGAEACAACHEEESKELKKTPHGQAGFALRSIHACETCHGPGQAHIDSGGDASKIKSFAALKGDDASQVCLGCHESAQRANWKGSVHQQRELACISCHTVHHPKSDNWLLKTGRVEETCNGCHVEVKAQIQRTSHHPIREGLMSCNDCHNPHGTLTPKLILANSVNEQCYTCHTEKRGPFLWSHPPVQENCLNCHAPHGSNHEKLLVQNRPWLCQSCHLDTRHPGTLYDATNQLTSNRELSRSCSNCHLNIHGSNHPSGRVFTR